MDRDNDKKYGSGDLFKDGYDAPVDLSSEADDRELTDLALGDRTQSGSFDIRSLEETSIGKVLQVIPMPVLFLDSRCTIVYINRAGQKLLGAACSLLGMSFLRLFDESSAKFVIKSAIGRVFSNRKLSVIESVSCSGRAPCHARLRLSPVRRKTGRFVLVTIEDLSVERTLIEVMRDDRNHLETLVETQSVELEESRGRLRSEIDRRKLAENQLTASDIIFKTVIQSVGDGVFVKDTSLRYVHANPALEKLLGIPSKRLVGKTDAEIFPNSEISSVVELEQRVLAGDVIETEKGVLINGSIAVLNEVRTPFRDDDGQVIGLCGVVRDVTERKPDRTARELTPEGDATSTPMRDALNLASIAAKSDATILLLGETGSGKDYLARFVHHNSHRSSGPFITVNCAAIPHELMESELFGHEAGAFTGAARRKRGQAELAEGGTLLLNEIAELPVPLQAKLLTFLDYRTFFRVGGEKALRPNVRMIFATNRDPAEEVASGRFRADLFHRINVISISVPPLRERVQDIQHLAQQLLSELCSHFGIAEIPLLTPATVTMLKHYSWPGNVRELRNVLERSLILMPPGSPTLPVLEFPDTAPSRQKQTWGISSDGSLNEILNEVKVSLIKDALRRSDGNRRKAAEILGIPYVSLRHYLKTFFGDKKYDQGEHE